MTRSSTTKLGLAAALTVALVLPAAAAARHNQQALSQARYHALQDRGDAVGPQGYDAPETNPITTAGQLYTY